MKKLKTTLLAVMMVLVGATSTLTVNAQEEEASSPFDAGFDIYTSYIWRGAKFGSGPAFQPWVSAAIGNLEIGAWGSVNAGGITDADVIAEAPDKGEALEMDLYAAYEIAGVGIAVTDYYFGGDWLADSTHYFEPALSYGFGDFSIMAAYGFSPTDAGEGDTYVEAGYSIAGLDIALGVGDGVYTDDGDFMICNISLGTSKEIKITDSFSLPLSGAVVLNPSTGGFFITAGISF